ncbi:hypothetical protein D9M70_642980 [compost metagenome]
MKRRFSAVKPLWVFTVMTLSEAGAAATAASGSGEVMGEDIGVPVVRGRARADCRNAPPSSRAFHARAAGSYRQACRTPTQRPKRGSYGGFKADANALALYAFFHLQRSFP